MSGPWVVLFVLQWLLLIVLALLMAGVLRYLSLVQERIQQAVVFVTRFEAGERITPFSARAVGGTDVRSETLFGLKRNVLLLVLTPTCGSCEAVIRHLAEIDAREGGFARLGWSPVLVVLGAESDARELVRKSLSARGMALSSDVLLLVDPLGKLASDYQVSALPVGLAISSAGILLDQSANPSGSWLYRTVGTDTPRAAPNVPVSRLLPANAPPAMWVRRRTTSEEADGVESRS